MRAGFRLRGDGSTDAFHVAALTALVLATALAVLLCPQWLVLGLITADRAPAVAAALLIVFLVLPALGWTLLALRRPVAALAAGLPSVLAGVVWIAAWFAFH